MKKRTLSLVLVISIIASFLTVSPIIVSAETSGTCGDNLMWSLSDTGRLVIRGEGDMTSAPWLAEHKSDITEVKIRDGVTSIYKNAFNGCENLTDIDIADTVTTIGGSAFYKCEKLTSVYLPENVSTVGACAFGYCELLEEINFPDGVTVIGDSMFFRCLNLKNVTLPNTVEDIEQRAFYACTNLENIELKEGLKTIGNEAFDFTAFTNLIIPESVENIASSAFNHYSNLILNVYDGSYALDYAQKYSIPYVIIEKEKTPAEKLCDLINTQAANSCTVDVKKQTVTLLSDVRLTRVLEIPTGGVLTLEIGEFDIFGADDLDAIDIPNEATINVIGTGKIKGGNVTENGYTGGNGISNSGILLIKGPTFIGGDALGDFGYAGAGVETYGASFTYFAEGLILAGEGYYHKSVAFERLNLTVVKESDDGINYSVVNNSLFSDKKYLKAIKISDDLSAPSKFAALLNEIQSGTCSVEGNQVTLHKDFSCPYEIYLPTGNAIVLDFNGHTVTTYDFFVPFIILEETEITFKGNGILTNKEKTPGHHGALGAHASLIPNEGKLTIDGITVIGVGLDAISNDGDLVVNSGKITVSDYSTGKDAIYNKGTITVNGGEIIGGNATLDGEDGGDGISGGTSVIPLDGIYPIKLNGGVLCGGTGLGDGACGRAISKAFNIGKNCVAYESDDGTNYLKFENSSSYKQYLKVEEKIVETWIDVQNLAISDGKISFDLLLFTDEQIVGTIYVAVYEGEKLYHIKSYTAEEEIPVSVNYSQGQKIRVFWWEENLLPIRLPKEVPTQ